MFYRLSPFAPLVLLLILGSLYGSAFPYAGILIGCILCFVNSILSVGRSSNFLCLLVAWLSSSMTMSIIRKMMGVRPTSWRGDVLFGVDFRYDYTIALVALSIMTGFLVLVGPSFRHSHGRGSKTIPIISIAAVAMLIMFLGARNDGEKGELIIVGLSSLTSALICIQVGRERMMSAPLISAIAVAVLVAIAFGFRYVAWYYFCAFALSVEGKSSSRGRFFFLVFFVAYPVVSAYTAALRQLGLHDVGFNDAIKYWGAAEEILTWQLHYFLNYHSASPGHIWDMIISILPNSGSRNSAAVLAEALPRDVRYGGSLNIGAYMFAEGAKIGGSIGVILYPLFICAAIYIKRRSNIRVLKISEACTPLLVVTWAYYGFTNGMKYYLVVILVSALLFNLENRGSRTP